MNNGFNLKSDNAKALVHTKKKTKIVSKSIAEIHFFLVQRKNKGIFN